MGNQQSNERKRNYKVYKITSVDEHSSWKRCHLDDYVPYNDGNYKRIDFEKDSTGFALLRLGAGAFGHNDSRAILSEGWYIAIDIDWTRNFSSGYEFSQEFAKTVGRRNNDETVGGFQELIGDIAEGRERYARANEWADFDKQMQRTWQLQPPKK